MTDARLSISPRTTEQSAVMRYDLCWLHGGGLVDLEAALSDELRWIVNEAQFPMLEQGATDD